MRAKPYKRRRRIFLNSLYDITVGVMPVVLAVSDYHNVWSYHIAEVLFMLTLLGVYKV